MINMTMPDEVLKVDSRGRVRISEQRREALLDEFEKSGLSGWKFAALAGVKYQTFVIWIRKRRSQRGSEAQAAPLPVQAAQAPVQVAAPKALEWIEAVAEAGARGVSVARELRLELPGGASARISHASQAALAARLLRELAAIEGRPC